MSRIFIKSIIFSLLVTANASADNSADEATTEDRPVFEGPIDTDLLAISETTGPPLLRDNFQGCSAEPAVEKVRFFNTGSLCTDGLVAHMEGRGCEKIMARRRDSPSGDWMYTYYYCDTEPTCDRLHTSTFVLVSSDVLPSDYFGSGWSVWCADNSTTILQTAGKIFDE